MASKKSVGVGQIILTRRTTKLDRTLWVNNHCDNLHFSLTCHVGEAKRDELLHAVEKELRVRRLAADKRKKKK